MNGSDDGRIDAAVELLARLTSGDLSARGVRSSAGDGLDAVVDGINALAADLEASQEDVEAQVRARTAHLEHTNRGVLRLTEFGTLLETRANLEDAHQAISDGLSSFLEGLRGAFYRLRSPRGRWELQTTWGGLDDAPVELATDDCWAVRLRVVHAVQASAPSLSCPHVAERTGDSICVPIFVHGETVGLLHVMDPEPVARRVGGLSRATRQLAASVGDQVALSLSNLELRARLEDEALRDSLTGLHNRRFVSEWIEREVSQSDRSGQPFGLIMVDVDHFKQVNDIHGHDAGDEMLKVIATTFRSALRLSDMPCRYGGEEFLILLPGIDLDALRNRAEALRQRVADLRVEHCGTTLPQVTVSAGVAVYPTHGGSAAEVVQAADAAMYAAKRAGRNRVRSALRPL